MAEVTILLDRDGKYVDASPAALDMLGVSLDELRALPAGALSDVPLDTPEAQALREAFAQSGASRAVGTGIIRRPDGRRLHVRFHLDQQPDGRYLALLKQAEAATGEQPAVMFTIGQVLAAWRDAERRLEGFEPNSPEWLAVQGEVELFRTEYRRLADGRRRPSTA